MEEHSKFMETAIKLSQLGLGTTSPNPVVGCVIVNDGVVVGTGYHEQAGKDHAEVVALKAAGEKARNATVYVTLEPCSVHGRTPPCTDALIAAGVKRVVAAVRDPNPRVSGKGFEKLKKAGIEVIEGVLRKQASVVNRRYLTFMRAGRPYVTLKLALTLDGKIADTEGKSKWITGEKARLDVQELRRLHDAVAVGAGTYLKDNPRLTYRLDKPKIPPLTRIIMCGTTEEAQQVINKGALDRGFVLAVPEESELSGDRVLKVKASDGRLELNDFLLRLKQMGITSLLVEGGAKVFSDFFSHGLYDEIVLYLAPKVFGAGLEAFQLNSLFKASEPLQLNLYGAEVFDEDVRLTYFNKEVFF